MPRFILLGLLVVFVGPGPAVAVQEGGGPRIPSKALLADVDLLRRLEETAHPGLYRYNTRAQIEEHFAALRSEFSRDRTLPEAYIAISQFLARLQCGHSYANFFNQPKAVAQTLFSGKNRVPFLFRWIDGRMIVTRDLTPDGTLKPGTEILALNGHPVGEILARLLTIARADGANQGKRLAYLEVRGKDRYEAFDIFLPLFYLDTAEQIRLTLRAPGAKAEAEVVVGAHDPLQREALASEAQTPRGEDQPLWRFETLDDGAAYLRMPGWALYNSKWDWKGFLDAGIDDLIDRKAPALIVDLRDNEGGLDVGNLLLERVATKPVRAGGMARYTRYRSLPEDLFPHLSTWDPSFKDWGDKAVPDRSGFFRLTKYDDDAQGDVISPRGRRFEGRLIVLVNAANSSATFHFAKLVKENGLGTLVGQATGGNRRGINGGAFFFATLPNSQVEFDLPLIATFPADAPLPDGKDLPFLNTPDAGVEPHVKVTPRVDDLIRGEDPELKAARDLLKAGTNPGRSTR